MTALQAYLQNSRTRKLLNKKPGEAGFSLIELVVVVAVLAILSAIAIPAFTSINNKARSSAASNTVATIVKKCAVEAANGNASASFGTVTVDSYSTLASSATPTTNCTESGTLTATSSDTSKYPTFVYNFTTGIKTCSVATTMAVATADSLGCRNTVLGVGAGTW